MLGRLLVTRFDYFKSTVRGTAFLDKRTAVTCGGNRNELVLWDPSSGEIRGKIDGPGNTVYAVGLNLSDDGLKIAFGNSQVFIKDENNLAPLERVIDLSSSEVDEIGNFTDIDFERVRSQRDGWTIGYDQNDYQWDKRLLVSRDGMNTSTPLMVKESWLYAESFTITDKSLVIAGGRRDGRIAAYRPNFDRSNGVHLAWFIGHIGDVWDVATCGDWLVSCGSDQTIRLWNISDLENEVGNNNGQSMRVIEPELSLFISQDNEWVVWSKSGFYNSSLEGDKYVGFHVNRGEDANADFYSCSRFVNTLYRPDVIKEILACGSESIALKNLGFDEELDIESILPPTVTLSGEPSRLVETDTIDLSFEVTHSQEQPLTKVWLLVDGYPEWEWTPEQEGKPVVVNGVQTFTAPNIPMIDGSNQIQVLAKTAVSQSNPLALTIQAAINYSNTRGVGEGTRATRLKRIQPNLYVLAIGVSKYQHGKTKKSGAPKPGIIYNLNYADDDAKAICTQLKNLSGRSFNSFAEVKIIEPDGLTNQKATKPAILAAAKKLKQTIDRRNQQKAANQQKARDVAIVFLAGHGIQRIEKIGIADSASNKAVTKKVNKFYFLGYDANPADIGNTSVSMVELGEIINSLKAEVILMIDACHSGRAGYNFNNKELTKRWAEINSRAQVIFSATVADRLSVEHSSWGHGAFTKGLIEILKEKKSSSIFQFFPDVSAYVTDITHPERRGKGKSRRPQIPTISIIGALSNFTLKRLRPK